MQRFRLDEIQAWGRLGIETVREERRASIYFARRSEIALQAMLMLWRGVNKGGAGCVQQGVMIESTFPIEFIGGSRDGEVVEATAAPDYFEVPVAGALREIYERQNSEPPFVYVQIGYAEKERWN